MKVGRPNTGRNRNISRGPHTRPTLPLRGHDCAGHRPAGRPHVLCRCASTTGTLLGRAIEASLISPEGLPSLRTRCRGLAGHLFGGIRHRGFSLSLGRGRREPHRERRQSSHDLLLPTRELPGPFNRANACTYSLSPLASPRTASHYSHHTTLAPVCLSAWTAQSQQL